MATGLVAIAPTADVLDLVPDALDLLTDSERMRAARLRQEADRRDFVAAHVLVRLCAAYRFGLSLRTPLGQRCPSCDGAHGPAHLLERPQVGISLSHAAGVVGAAVAETPVAVDAEPLTAANGLASLAAQIASPAEAVALTGQVDPEAALLLLWVRKEALVKLGHASIDDMPGVDLSGLPLTVPAGGGHRRLRWDGYALVDLWLTGPAAVGAVISESEIAVVGLDRLADVARRDGGPGLSRPLRVAGR